MPVDITNWSRIRFLTAILAVVFAVEAAVMMLLSVVLPLHVHHGLEALLDAGLLSALSAPILWLVLLRPLRQTALAAKAKHEVIVLTAPDGIVTVKEGRMYNLIDARGDYAEKLLELTFLDPGTKVYAFTFG